MDARIEHRPERNRFEARADDSPAGHLDYRLAPGVMTILHTEVDEAFEGRGVGAALVRAALEHARRERLRVDARCSYARAYMDRHPETHDLRAA